MQAQLETAEAAEAAEAIVPTDNMPAIVRHYIESFPRYLAAIEAAERAVVALVSEEGNLRRDEGPNYRSAWTWTPISDRSVRNLRRDVAAAIVVVASRHFSPTSTPLPISDTDAHPLLEQSSINGEPDFNKLWQLLDQTYGGDAGERLLMSTAAQTLRRAFGLRETARREWYEPVLSKGSITFKMWSRVGKSFSSGYEIDYSNARELREVAIACSLLCPEHFNVDALLRPIELNRKFPKLPLRLDARPARWILLKDETRFQVPEQAGVDLLAALDQHDPLASYHE